MIRIAHLVHLDSNIVSKLPRYFNSVGQDGELNSLIDHLIEKSISINASPYCLEDSLNKTGMMNGAKVYECLLYYALLRRIVDTREKGRIPLQPADYVDADELLYLMRSNRAYHREREMRARSIYCFLLKTYIIEFASKRPARKKAGGSDRIYK